jgi:hypothetical protein
MIAATPLRSAVALRCDLGLLDTGNASVLCPTESQFVLYPTAGRLDSTVLLSFPFKS